MTTVIDSTSKINFDIGGKVEHYNWHWQGKYYQVVYETIGHGSPVLDLLHESCDCAERTLQANR